MINNDDLKIKQTLRFVVLITSFWLGLCAAVMLLLTDQIIVFGFISNQYQWNDNTFRCCGKWENYGYIYVA